MRCSGAPTASIRHIGNGAACPTRYGDGPIAQTLEESEIEYVTRIPGDLKSLTPDAQLTIYRLACESVAYLLDRWPEILRIHLSVRLYMAGHAHDTPWVVLIVDGRSNIPSAEQSNSLATPRSLITREHLLARLGAMGLREEAMRDRVSLYDGEVRVEEHQKRISVSLLDAADIPLSVRRRGSLMNSANGLHPLR